MYTLNLSVAAFALAVAFVLPAAPPPKIKKPSLRTEAVRALASGAAEEPASLPTPKRHHLLAVALAFASRAEGPLQNSL